MYLAGERKLCRDTLRQEEDVINKKKFYQVLSPLPCEHLHHNEQMSNAFRSLCHHSTPLLSFLTQAPHISPPSNALFVVPQRFEVARFPSWLPTTDGIHLRPSGHPRAIPGPAAVQYAFMPSTINMWVPHECGLMTCSKRTANTMHSGTGLSDSAATTHRFAL